MYNINLLYKNGFDDKLIKLIATEYAITPYEYSREYFQRKYCITPYYFNKIIDCSVIYDLVSQDILNKMINKATVNSVMRCKSSRYRVEKHFFSLINDRNYLLEVKLNNISEEKEMLLFDYKFFLETENSNFKVDGTYDSTPSIEIQLKEFKNDLLKEQ